MMAIRANAEVVAACERALGKRPSRPSSEGFATLFSMDAIARHDWGLPDSLGPA